MRLTVQLNFTENQLPRQLDFLHINLVSSHYSTSYVSEDPMREAILLHQAISDSETVRHYAIFLTFKTNYVCPSHVHAYSRTPTSNLKVLNDSLH